MKRGFIIGGAVLGVLVIAVVAVVIFVLSSLDDIVKTAVEKVGSEVTQAKVTLDKADISISSGTGALRGLTVGNPAGYKTDKAVSLGEVSVAIDLSTIQDNPVVIKEVVIAAPSVTYEMGGSAGSNIDAIKQNVDAFMARNLGGGESSGSGGSGETGGSGGGDKAATGSEPEKKVVIENLYIRDGEVSVSADLLEGRKMTVALPAIHLTDIGKDKGGATPAEVAEKILSAITGATSQAVASLGLDELMKGAGDIANEATKALEGGVGGAAAGATKALEEAVGGTGTGDAGGAGKAIEEGAGKAEKALNSLFGGSD